MNGRYELECANGFAKLERFKVSPLKALVYCVSLGMSVCVLCLVLCWYEYNRGSPVSLRIWLEDCHKNLENRRDFFHVLSKL